VSDRTVHAALGPREIVRYDRQGRWYDETPERRTRIATVHDAAALALVLEDNGGEVLEGQPGGLQFDAKVSGARQRQARGVKR
jgi:hypothetical protein